MAIEPITKPVTLLDDPSIRDIRLKKGTPRVVEKLWKKAAIEKHRVSIKAEIFHRDGHRCRCCGGHATELHELKSRGAGGKRSRENSIAVCGFGGSHCHRLLQTYVISAECIDKQQGADQPIKFTAGSRVWFG